MPRRRKTRLATRAKPLLPEDRPTDDLDMEKETREQKLENYLKDFDLEVEKRIGEMNALCNSLCRNIKSAANMSIMKMPKETKNMTVSDYFAQDSVTPSVKVLQQISKTVDEMITLPQTVADAISSSESEDTAASSNTESDPDNSEATEKPKRSTRSTRKAPATRKKATTTTAKRASARKRTRAALQETPANNDNTRSALQTPANAMSMSSISTPFITPKFDPSSKMTPATMRRAKKGELLVSLSGSPVEARNSPKEPTQAVEMFKEKLKENMETLFTQDDVDRKNILILQETLSRLLKDTS